MDTTIIKKCLNTKTFQDKFLKEELSHANNLVPT